MNDDTSASADERDAMAADGGEGGDTTAIWAALHRERAARVRQRPKRARPLMRQIDIGIRRIVCS
ncbi:hypothetical protein [Rhodomicrobium sp.]|uniref:hypothetical protein n=1 Tax=Rhodomicrobium sp. TaxID=2720632 RepID=UPI0039E5CF63